MIVKIWIIMQQFTDPEILSIKEGPRWETQMSLGRGNRIDFAARIGVRRDGNKRD